MEVSCYLSPLGILTCNVLNDSINSIKTSPNQSMRKHVRFSIIIQLLAVSLHAVRVTGCFDSLLIIGPPYVNQEIQQLWLMQRRLILLLMRQQFTSMRRENDHQATSVKQLFSSVNRRGIASGRMLKCPHPQGRSTRRLLPAQDQLRNRSLKRILTEDLASVTLFIAW